MRSLASCCAALLFFAVVPAVATAQDLADGTWTGTVTPPDGYDVSVSYLVSHPNDTLSIEMQTPMGNFPFQDIRFDEGVLLFSWTPGVALTCELSPQDGGGFEGECLDEGGNSGTVTMTPPAADEE